MDQKKQMMGMSWGRFAAISPASRLPQVQHDPCGSRLAGDTRAKPSFFAIFWPTKSPPALGPAPRMR